MNPTHRLSITPVGALALPVCQSTATAASHRPHHHTTQTTVEVTMNPIRLARLIRRVAVILAGLTGSLLALSTGSPATFAYVLPPHPTGGTVGPPPVHTIVTGGMPGWQITLIAVAVAIIAATGAVRLDRARAARRHQTATSA